MFVRLLLGGIVSVFVVLLFLPALLRLDSVSSVLLTEAESFLGYDIEAKAMQLFWFPRPRFTLADVDVRAPEGTSPLLSARRIVFDLEPLGFLGRRPLMRSVRITGAQLLLRRNPSGVWNISGGGHGTAEAPRDLSLVAAALPASLSMTETRLTVVDQTNGGMPAGLEVTDLALQMTRDPARRMISLTGTGSVQNRSGPGSLRLTASVLAPAEADASRADASRSEVLAEASIHLGRIDVSDLATLLEWPVDPEVPWPAEVTAQVAVRSEPGHLVLHLPRWTISGDAVSLQGQGVVNLDSDPPQFFIAFASPRVDMKPLVHHLALRRLAPDLAPVITAHQPEATVEVASMLVAGSLGTAEAPTVIGRLSVSSGRLAIRPHGPDVTQLSGVVLFDPGQIRVRDLRGRYGPVDITDGWMRWDYRSEPPVFDLVLKGDADAGAMVSLLRSEGTLGGQARWLDTIDEAGGPIRVSLHFRRRDAGRDVGLDEAEVIFNDVHLVSGALEAPLTNLSGRISYSPGTVAIEAVKGRLEDVDLSASGEIALVQEGTGQAAWVGTLTVNADASGAALAAWLVRHDAAPADLDLDGTARLSVSLSGPVQQPRFQGTLDLTGLGMNLPRVLLKHRGRPAGLSFAGYLSSSEVVVDRFLATFASNEVAGHAVIDRDHPCTFEAELVMPGFSIPAMAETVSMPAWKGGLVNGVARAAGRGCRWQDWRLKGWLRVQDAHIEADRIPISSRDLDAEVHIERDRLVIDHLTGTIGVNGVRVAGTLENWLKAPRGELVVEASAFDFGTLVSAWRAGDEPSKGREQRQAWVPDWLASADVTTIVLIDHAYYERFLLSSLSCRLVLADGILAVEALSADTDAGHLAGRLSLDLSGGSRRLSTSVRLTGIPIERLFTVSGEEEAPLTGWLTLNGTVSLEIGPNGVVPSSLESPGVVYVIVEDGRIHNMPVVASILKLLNLPSLLQGEVDLTRRGMRYDRLVSELQAVDGMVRLKQLVLESPILRITAAGTYDLVRDRWDAVFAASPFGSYSNLVKRVPLFGTLFAGDRSGLVTAMFEVGGPLRHPTVEYLPIESLARGLGGLPLLAFDLLRNAVTLPKEVVSLFEDGEAPGEPRGSRTRPVPPRTQ
ncbi:AsmA family protein [Candidatus Nitrospira bockiana]